jgi:tRNA A-37 threonylcarbamoyl transferase component Bud32
MALSGKMFTKDVKSELEVDLQTIASKHNFSPRILKTEEHNGMLRIYMEDLEEEVLAVEYGEDPSDVPVWIWNEIRRMVQHLYDEEGIEYVDITPYNFIEKNGRIYMIDFGDAKYTNGTPDWFLAEFLEGENSWNPDYK